MAAIDFPNTPTVGQIFTSNDRSWVWTGSVWNSYGGGTSHFVPSPTPPTSPVDGDIWFDTNTGRSYIWYDSTWVEMTGAPSAMDAALLTGSTLAANVVNSSLKFVPSAIYRVALAAIVNVPAGGSPVVLEILPVPTPPSGSLVIMTHSLHLAQTVAGVFDVGFDTGMTGRHVHQEGSGIAASGKMLSFSTSYIADGGSYRILTLINAWGGKSIDVQVGSSIAVQVYGSGRF